jgi:hypothetical protein
MSQPANDQPENVHEYEETDRLNSVEAEAEVPSQPQFAFTHLTGTH